MKKALSILVLSSSFLFSQGFTLKSETISGQLGIKQVFNGFGCTGENISPKLSWENPPKKTKSFAITMYDPDAPTGSGWWHWIVFDIPKDKKELKESFGNKESKEIVQSVTK
ncbi:YbhB/YbcL family Raf kinase inhibitor-like protein [Malaciobacter mytili]|uniref:YbhB/YbcL family Raf kinase inhibitor-like protein n=1 Tax=Malaciobacter mytili TaxID=603050 RepID=UPI002B05A6B3|nr:YbhB/YbcL family Raf kinase inhibitor-like protein [Malaciobacter mytili]